MKTSDLATSTTHQTGIEWTHVPGYTGATWNPVRGCTKVSPGCKHCYAETFAERWRGVPGHPYEQGFDLRLVPEKLAEPLRATKPRAYFVNSMSDLFHDDVPLDYIAAVFSVMSATPQHTYQVLTKRPERMVEFFAWLAAGMGDPRRSNRQACAAIAWAMFNEMGNTVAAGRVYDQWIHHLCWPLHNVWLGVSVEDRRYGLPRIDVLREVPAAVRFLSVEPLLEDLGTLDLTGIDWVIVGGESGPGCRPMREEWALSIRDQCAAAGVPFFFKQWGGLNKKARGSVLDGKVYQAFPKCVAAC